MLNHQVPFALATVATALFPAAANAARPCGGAGSYQYPMGDVRYDSPDPNKGNGLATIAASLGRSPLYECVAQWPESWAGWYEGGTNLIWADCIWTGAGLGQDESVSFAVDWKTKTMYLSHVFDCSDQAGSQGLATGSISLEVNCTTVEEDGSSFCIPLSTSTGTRPALSVNTELEPASLNATSTCAENVERYQSWKVEQWLRRIEMEPGSSPTNPKLVSDSGPSFTLRSMTNNNVFSCAPVEQQNNTFIGECQSANNETASISTEFTFDAELNILHVAQHWDCGDSTSFDVVGVAFIEGACDRAFNSNEFTCTSDHPVWVGTGVV
ncbi:Ig-like domain-containing protein [Madurella fahalii]|uniref:Ig-like domain-containing protein n=1 Tax=Madurella fahalii TaxID=1157608 RepID=A0ABQ0G4Y5_9PEZI